MRRTLRLILAGYASGMWLLSPNAGTLGDEPAAIESRPVAAVPREQEAVDRALRFLVDDMGKWRQVRGCATCHHGAMTVWALFEAQQRGYPVSAEVLDDTVQW